MTGSAVPRSLAGVTVALLRNPERAAGMAREFVLRGAEVLLAPMIDWELPADTAALSSGLRAASSYDWVLFTSVTTVRALDRQASVLGTPLAELLRGAKIAGVGPATGEALEKLGIRVDLLPDSDQSAAGLLAALPPEPARVLLPQSDIAADTLGAGLQGRGWSVDVVTAYVTVDYPARTGHTVGGTEAGHDGGAVPGALTRTELAEAIRSGAIDAVVLTSPSIAGRLHAMMGPLPAEVATIAIGRRTQHDASALGLRIDAVAATPSPAGVADAVAAVVHQPKEG